MGEPEEQNPEEDKKSRESEETAADAAAPSSDESSSPSSEKKPFESLDLREAYVFGWEKNPQKSCWYNLSLQARSVGWSKANINQLESSLKKNVEACYFHLASFYFVDLEDEVRYHAYFDTMKMLWRLEIEDSPEAEIEPQQIGDFFKSDLMVKCARRAAEVIRRAAEEFEQNLRTHLESGQLLAVDEVKLDAILSAIAADITVKSLEECKWMTD